MDEEEQNDKIDGKQGFKMLQTWTKRQILAGIFFLRVISVFYTIRWYA